LAQSQLMGREKTSEAGLASLSPMTRRASDRHLAAVPDGFFSTLAFLM